MIITVLLFYIQFLRLEFVIIYIYIVIPKREFMYKVLFNTHVYVNLDSL